MNSPIALWAAKVGKKNKCISIGWFDLFDTKNIIIHVIDNCLQIIHILYHLRHSHSLLHGTRLISAESVWYLQISIVDSESWRFLWKTLAIKITSFVSWERGGGLYWYQMNISHVISLLLQMIHKNNKTKKLCEYLLLYTYVLSQLSPPWCLEKESNNQR